MLATCSRRSGEVCIQHLRRSLKASKVRRRTRQQMLDVFSSVGALDARNGAPGEMCKSHQRLEAIAETLAHDAIFLRHWCHMIYALLTNVAPAKQSATLGRAHLWGRSLELRSRWGARLAHRVCAMHLDELVGVKLESGRYGGSRDLTLKSMEVEESRLQTSSRDGLFQGKLHGI